MAKYSEFAIADLDEAKRVKLLYGLVIPRPIAVVSSMSSDGLTNIAPFSFFNLIGEEPAALSFSITAQKANGADKDTLRNVRPSAEGGLGEFVVNVATANYVAQIAKCGTSLDFGDSEFEFAGLTPTPSITVKPPRIAEARACFECKTMNIIKVGRSRLVLGEIRHISVETRLLDANSRIDATGLDPVGRLAGRCYCRLGKRFEL